VAESRAFDLGAVVAALMRDGSSQLIEPDFTRPPVRVDGFTVGAPFLTGDAPHRGELHPDGDELHYQIAGSVDVVLDDGDQSQVGVETTTTLEPGQAFVVPKGVWHRVHVREPSHFVHITPGPGSAHRPL
jgi:mannose-6-phosphate isomerase-like protein (cupin superfamily)